MRPSKPYSNMTTAELRRATREFDQPNADLPGRPLTPAERRQFQRVIRRGRPRVGLGAEKIQISVERSLLVRADHLARQLHVTRSELIARGLRAALALQEN